MTLIKENDQSVSAGELFVQTLNFVVIDLETTGLDPEKDEIIEIAAIKYEHGQKKDVFQSYVRPRHGIPKFIQYLTHISPQTLEKAPSIGNLLKPMLQFIGDSIVVGHNIAFDVAFLNQALVNGKLLPMLNEYWDTSELGRIYHPFTSDHSLGTMCRHFGIELVNAHRADADASATGELMLHLASHAVSYHSMIINAKLYELSRQAQANDTALKFLYRAIEWQRRNLGAKSPATFTNTRVNVIEHLVKSDSYPSMEDVFGAQGVLEQKFENFEYRAGQLQMGQAVHKAFRDQKHLAVEAGTGVGKSFAYLVPAIEHASRQKTCVVVSTNTKNLQEQLFFKDIPFLQRVLPISFKAVLVKGRENYICVRRWEEMMREQAKGLSAWEARGLMYLYVWELQTHTGDVSENSSFDRKRFGSVWHKINSDRFSCMGRKCPYQQNCYVMKLRKHIDSASIVVANHALLLADLNNENSTLGEYAHLVVDEAHNLPDAASNLLGFELPYIENSHAFFQLAGAGKKRGGLILQIENNIKKSVLDNAAKEQAFSLLDKLEKDIETLRKINTNLYQEAAKRVEHGETYGKLRIKNTDSFADLYSLLQDIVQSWKVMMKDLQALSNVFSSFNSQLIFAHAETMEALQSTYQRFLETEGKLLNLLSPDLENYALWLEAEARPQDRNTPSASFCYAPVEVDKNLYDLLYSKVGSIIFTSATLALRGSFKYFFSQSGLQLVDAEKIRSVIVDSPFDYDKQSKLMVSSFLPEPKDKFFMNQALSCLEQILQPTNVGTMMLFTSYKDLNTVYDRISDGLFHRGRPFFAQGKIGSRSSILEEFKNHKNAVLLGTSSFWEGVDVQGESLSLLILFKLPFLVPAEPIVEAYIDKLEREGKDSFMHFMLPNALLRLRQGFGRLIRSKSDRGAVLIMDSRVSTKKYGSYFKQVLPTRCLELSSELDLINQVTQFFNKP